MPVLIKPRTQVLSRTHSKGVRVTDRSRLASLYRKFVAGSSYGAALLSRVPDAGQAMIQAYYPDAATRIYVLAAFLDRSGVFFAARSGMKIFQRPRTLGIGLCFEDAPLDPRVSEGARSLARRVGYYGVFQLEFISVGGRYLLIDYNPRFYNQLAFDMARGLALPRIAYAAACGATDEMARLMAEAGRPGNATDLVFCNEFGLELMMATQRLAGKMSRADVRWWRSWCAEHRGKIVNPVAAPEDRLPALVDLAAQVHDCVRHPRAFLRNVVLDRAAG